jgi:hypothetical protein
MRPDRSPSVDPLPPSDCCCYTNAPKPKTAEEEVALSITGGGPKAPPMIGASRAKWGYIGRDSWSCVAVIVLVIIGAIMFLAPPKPKKCPDVANCSLYYVADWILQVGLMGYCGAITHYLIIRMLFKDIPYLYGSGVIPRNHTPIIIKMKEVVVTQFFGNGYLARYIGQKCESAKTDPAVTALFMKVAESKQIQTLIEEKSGGVFLTPNGFALMMMGITQDSLATMFKSWMRGATPRLVPLAMERVPEIIAYPVMLAEVDKLMSERMVHLTGEMVSQLIYDVLWDKVEWIVVWGALWGAIIGLLLKAIQYPYFPM